MTNEELSKTLRTASESVNDNIPLSVLLVMAAERIESLSQRVSDMGWELNPERIGQ
jgi:hypothetical protein